MRSKFSPQMQVVKKEEKEGKIRQFIEEAMLAYANAPARPLGLDCCLLVRSTDSPAARMLAAVLVELEAQGARVRTILTAAGAVQLHVDADPSAGTGLLGECRISTDMRLLEAHEQLVIGRNTVWIGDCMRRDPARRDAYEFYSHDCEEMAGAARRSFEKLWAQATAGVEASSPAIYGQPIEGVPPGVVPSATGSDTPPAPTAATRH